MMLKLAVYGGLVFLAFYYGLAQTVLAAAATVLLWGAAL
jgi:hypothetical protein